MCPAIGLLRTMASKLRLICSATSLRLYAVTLVRLAAAKGCATGRPLLPGVGPAGALPPRPAEGNLQDERTDKSSILLLSMTFGARWKGHRELAHRGAGDLKALASSWGVCPPRIEAKGSTTAEAECISLGGSVILLFEFLLVSADGYTPSRT